jgi:hypothetical protein
VRGPRAHLQHPLDHRGDLAALGEAEIADRFHGDGRDQAHAVGVELTPQVVEPGRGPQRTIYAATASGRTAAADWAARYSPVSAAPGLKG